MAWNAQTTAEHVLAVSEAVTVYPLGATVAQMAAFIDITPAQAEAALELAVELTLLSVDAQGKYVTKSSLCRFLSSRDQAVKSTVLRVVLETYPPFISFRERWLATADLAKAANQSCQLHGLSLHRDAMKETLVSLATFAGVFLTSGGGRYELADETQTNPLAAMSQACKDTASAEQRVRMQLGPDASQSVSKTEVIDPLVTALLKCTQPNSARDSVVAASNAVESFLFQEGKAKDLTVATAHGINAKLQLFKTASLIPDKLLKVGGYIGHVRNAADHGTDPEIGLAWSIQQNTGIEFAFISCSFISNLYAHLNGHPGTI
jgi:hypothetical protein